MQPNTGQGTSGAEQCLPINTGPQQAGNKKAFFLLPKKPGTPLKPYRLSPGIFTPYLITYRTPAVGGEKSRGVMGKMGCGLGMFSLLIGKIYLEMWE